MKVFNIAQNQQIIFGRVIPKNAIYGKYTHKGVYNKKLDGVFETVKNKYGEIVFNKNGIPKVKQVYKKVPFENTVVYCLENFKEYRRKDSGFFQIYILNKSANYWKLAETDDNATLQALYLYLKNMMKKVGKLEKPEEPFVKGVHDRVALPTRREVQKDYTYKGQFGYAVNPNVINENVKPKMPIIHSNMDKCHPINDKPVYNGKHKNDKIDTSNNPANGGYIHHEDGIITCRNGKKVIVTLVK